MVDKPCRCILCLIERSHMANVDVWIIGFLESQKDERKRFENLCTRHLVRVIGRLDRMQEALKEPN